MLSLGAMLSVSVLVLALAILALGCSPRPTDEHWGQGINAASSDACEASLDFVYPVLGASGAAGPDNTVDPRADGWYVQNCFAHSCDGCGTGVCSGNCTESFHPGEDFNRASNSCAANADAGESVVAVASGRVVDVHHLSASRHWVVIIRHDFPSLVDVSPYTLGRSIPENERWVDHVYSVYLHLDQPAVHEGDCVTRGQGIGQIANMTSGPHLHFEIVRPTALYEQMLARTPEPAVARTASGYYASLADLIVVGHIQPSAFIRDHRLTWHPVDTLVRSSNGDRFLIDQEQGRPVRRLVSPEVFIASRYDEAMVIDISRGELDCFDQGSPLPAPQSQELRKLPGVSTVWRVDQVTQTRAAFLSMEAFRSYGFHPGEVVEGWDGSWASLVWPTYRELDSLGLRDGALFRTLSDPRVYLVSQGSRLHVSRQDVFFRLGWSDPSVYRIGDGTEGVLTRSTGPQIGPEALWQCVNGERERSTEDCAYCDPSKTEGGSGSSENTDAPVSTPPSQPPAQPQPPTQPPAQPPVSQPWTILYLPDNAVQDVQRIEAWADGFGWQALPCEVVEREMRCTLPGPPGTRLQVSATLNLVTGQTGWSCYATAPCAYALRGTLRLVAPDGRVVDLSPAWNRLPPDHCWSCSASLGLELQCDASIANCGT